MQIIAAFHGTGKSYFTKKYDKEFSIINLDTSNFSHKIDSFNIKVSNPEFPHNFISTLTNLNSSYDLALIPIDKHVLNSLIEKNIDFELIYPDVSLRSDYVLRYIERGSSDDFIRFIDSKFEKLIHEIETNYLSIKKIKLMSKTQFLSNVLI